MKQNIEINEFIILQNPVIGSHILHEFSKRYYSEKKEGIKLPFLFIVLPIVFSKEYSNDISIRKFKIGSMLKSLNNENLYWDTLQQRMSDFSDITFQSINIVLQHHFYSTITKMLVSFPIILNLLSRQINGITIR